MVVLGLWDGLDSGAALVIDDAVVAVELQQRIDRTPRSRAFPWDALDAVLEEAGLRPADVDQVAIAGQFTPPLILRQMPGLRRMARDAFSPALDAAVFFQAVMKGTGLGAAEADRAVDHFAAVLGDHGIRPQRITMVDIHRGLAEAAYRTQTDDDAIVITLHPMGDGAAAAVHRGNDGQLDRAWTQKGFEGLHVHLRRCAAAIGLDPHVEESRMWQLAAKGVPDADLVERLRGELFFDGERLSRKSYPIPDSRQSPIYRALGSVEREVAAASVLANLTDTVCELVRTFVARWPAPAVCLGGSVFENPRLVAAVADVPGVHELWVHPTPGFASLPIGAAAMVGGIAPRALTVPGHGRQYSDRQLERVLKGAGLDPRRADDSDRVLADALVEGLAVARFAGRAGYGPHGGGTRSVLVRADDPVMVERVRSALDRPIDEEPVCLWDGKDAGVAQLGRLCESANYGVAATPVDGDFAEKYPAAVTRDGRICVQRVDAKTDPGLFRMLEQLRKQTGQGALACFALGEHGGPCAALPGDAVRIARRSGAQVMGIGGYVVRMADQGG